MKFSKRCPTAVVNCTFNQTSKNNNSSLNLLNLFHFMSKHLEMKFQEVYFQLDMSNIFFLELHRLFKSCKVDLPFVKIQLVSL